ncbi:GNAT family N-acetyltransferase [Phyllobacterium salinisoli]|uniref:GNAT family N-acetyltransferase n=1 Tax=Phyllobacterium salinisoli TaxID=1899321 RepID=A0A368K1T5_9HYPH|nr:GNAT family N-acetyltransferase [Phyllobacterium salinisoli]RCS23161.1 GNAT family N-acetyltransferase [Phyllobacterium salinisoli]
MGTQGVTPPDIRNDIRNARRDELDTIIDWAAREGWNPGIEDAPAFWAADPGGYHVAEVGGALAAAISLVRYDENYAFLGFYMAHPDFRGQGIGFALWQAAIRQGKGRTIGLDGVVAQQDNYRRSGFAYAHANFRYGGDVACDEPAGDNLVPVKPALLPMLLDYDRQFNPAPRGGFLSEWLKPAETRLSFALIDNSAIAGFATIRACREGFKIGPLFADNEAGADLLFRKLVASIGGGLILLDMPGPNKSAEKLCERYGMKPVFETARMYRGATPNLPLDRLYGITTFELG